MLENTFLHVPGVGRMTERLLWDKGCRDWDMWLADPDRYGMGAASLETGKEVLEASKLSLKKGWHQFFSRALGMAESWRAWEHFRDSTVYLDIETDGGQSGDAITIVGLYDRNGFRGLVREEDLHEFPDVISHYSCIVTFFGGGFDIPMLKRRFPKVDFDQIHIDLCPTLRRIGLKGGLKKIEKELGIARGDDTDGLTGWDAVRLWREHQRGSSSALETLLAYNREDVVNLEFLARHAYERLRALTLPPSMGGSEEEEKIVPTPAGNRGRTIRSRSDQTT